MDLKNFDATLKSALENIEVPFDASTWAALENRLDALPAPDAVDQVLRPALERIESPYDIGSWSTLTHRMDTIGRVRRLRMTKLAETAIFLLLLLNLKGFFGIVESVTKPLPVKKEIQEPIAKSQPSTAKKHIATSLSTDKNINPEENLNLAQQMLAFVQNATAVLTQDVDNQDLSSPANNPQPIVSNTSLLDPTNFYSQSGLVKFSVGPVLPAHPVEPFLIAGTLISIPGLEISASPKPSRLYAASFVSFDKNYLREGKHSDKKTGYGGGFAMGYRKGKWGVEAGLQYSQKRYQPERENIKYKEDPSGISYFHIDNVDADLFSTTVKATRRIAKVRSTSAHAVAGVSANFAVNKVYGYETVHYDPVPNPPNQPQPVLSPLPNAKGVLENGGLTHNAYATADLGLRVEQPLGKRYVAFVEPVFRQSLGGGLGPNSAQLSTFSFQAGVLASL